MVKQMHTPGPWHVDAHTNVMATGGMVAFPGIAAGFDQAANARLIAAAPELLDELIGMVRMAEKEGWEGFQRAKDAIAKATGSNI